jgi:DNA polymerase-3 subunit chi
MQNQVVFYVLNDDKHTLSTTSHEQDVVLYCACLQAAHFYRQNKKVFIYTQNQQQAHDVDDLLWRFEADAFVPHSLLGEGPSYGSPVEISWQAPKNRCAVLINLSEKIPDFANKFAYIVDFVPCDETLKELARARFRHYRQQGSQVTTENIVVSDILSLLSSKVTA